MASQRLGEERECPGRKEPACKSLYRPGISERLCLAYSKTPSTCLRSTPGNHWRKSSMLAPSSRFSNNAWTGTLEPRKTHEPLTFSGERSTSGHCDQSSILSIIYQHVQAHL